MHPCVGSRAEALRGSREPVFEFAAQPREHLADGAPGTRPAPSSAEHGVGVGNNGEVVAVNGLGKVVLGKRCHRNRNPS